MAAFTLDNHTVTTLFSGFKSLSLPRAVLVLLLIGVMFVVTSCGMSTLDIDQQKTESATIELGGAQTVRVELSMGSGQIKLAGGADKLMDGVFTYNVEDWRPEIQYTADDEVGRLSVRQPAYKDALPVNLGDIRYAWELGLNNDVPMDLSVKLGAGDGNLAIGNLTLERFFFEGGAGEVDIELRGSSASELSVALGAGDVTLDLNGVWQQDLEATIKGGLGRVTLILPKTSGARVTTQGMLSKINAPELINERGVYTNAAYDRAEVSMDIHIESGIGEIVLELGA